MLLNEISFSFLIGNGKNRQWQNGNSKRKITEKQAMETLEEEANKNPHVTNKWEMAVNSININAKSFYFKRVSKVVGILLINELKHPLHSRYYSQQWKNISLGEWLVSLRWTLRQVLVHESSLSYSIESPVYRRQHYNPYQWVHETISTHTTTHANNIAHAVCGNVYFWGFALHIKFWYHHYEWLCPLWKIGQDNST